MSTAIGRPTDRVDGPLKVAGRAPFSAEYLLPNMVFACVVGSTISKGRITEIDVDAAEQASGVLAVYTHLNAPRMKRTPVFNPMSVSPKASGTSVAILQTERIAWHGQPIALVVAETWEQARYAASLVKATYKEEPAKLDLETYEEDASQPKLIMDEKGQIKQGKPEKALEAAAAKVDNLYTTPQMNHNPIEPHATTAVWDGDTLTVYDASQYIFGVRDMLADKFSVAKENVHVIATYVGGGFGSKGLAWPHVALSAAAARALERPVRLVLGRDQMFSCVGHRSPTRQRVALGADAAGKLTALIHTGVSHTSTSNTFIEMFSFPARHLYACPNVLINQRLVELDVAPVTFMRAPGEATGTFALESAIDEMAYELRMDPVEFRARNEPEKDPTSGRPFSNRNIVQAYAVGADKFGWARRNPQPRSMRDGRFLIGFGVATAFYPYYRFPASATVRLLADGSAVVKSGAQEMGMGTATVHTMLTASLLGLPLTKVQSEHGNTDLPFAAVAGGSTTTVSAGSAIESACNDLKAQLVKLARKGDGPLRRAKAEQIECKNEGVFLTDDPACGETYAALLPRHERDSVEGRADTLPGKELLTHAMFSYGAQFCELGVDADLGEIRIRRFLGVFDSGRIINPKTARSQFIGGIVMGLGMALMEATHVDRRTGRVVNANLADYLLPVHADVPAIDAIWLDKPDPQAPLGAHGIGEIGITGVAAAVANAVFHATGRRIRDLPITLDKLL